MRLMFPVVSVLAALVAGCGSTSASTTTRPAPTTAVTHPNVAATPPAPALPVLLSRANTVCSRRNARVAALPPLTASTYAGEVASIRRLNARFLDEVRGIVPAGPADGRYSRFFDALQQAAGGGLQISAAVASGNTAEARALIGPQLAAAQSLLDQGKRLGIPDCGKAAARIGAVQP